MGKIQWKKVFGAVLVIAIAYIILKPILNPSATNVIAPRPNIPGMKPLSTVPKVQSTRNGRTRFNVQSNNG